MAAILYLPQHFNLISMFSPQKSEGPQRKNVAKFYSTNKKKIRKKEFTQCRVDSREKSCGQLLGMTIPMYICMYIFPCSSAPFIQIHLPPTILHDLYSPVKAVKLTPIAKRSQLTLIKWKQSAFPNLFSPLSFSCEMVLT